MPKKSPHSMTGTFHLFPEQQTDKPLNGLVEKDKRIPEIHLSPGEDKNVDLQTVKTLAKTINNSSHGKFIKVHVIPTESGWRTTIQPQNGTNVLEYTAQNLKELIAIEMAN